MSEKRLSREVDTEMSELSDKDFKAAIIQRGSLKGNFNFTELNENTLYQNMWNAAKAVLRDIYNTKCIH